LQDVSVSIESGLKGFAERGPDWGGGINLRYVF